MSKKNVGCLRFESLLDNIIAKLALENDVVSINKSAHNEDMPDYMQIKYDLYFKLSTNMKLFLAEFGEKMSEMGIAKLNCVDYIEETYYAVIFLNWSPDDKETLKKMSNIIFKSGIKVQGNEEEDTYIYKEGIEWGNRSLYI